jgi:hypothetical protein
VAPFLHILYRITNYFAMSADSMRHPSGSVSRFLSVPLIRSPEYPEKLVRIMAGSVTLTGLALGVLVSPWGYLLTAFAGANILQSAFTGFCPPEITYRWLTTTASPESELTGCSSVDASSC